MAHQRGCHAVGILLASWLACVAFAQTVENRILYPDVANLTFHYLDTVNVSFTTNYETPWMYHWCRDSAGNNQEILYYSPSDVVKRTWVAFKLQSNTQYTGTTCWFNLAPQQVLVKTDKIGVDSFEFNYVKTEDGSKTFGLNPTSTPTSTSAVSATAVPSGAATTSSTAAPAVTDTLTSSDGLSTGAKAGIGVGASLGGIGIAALAAFLLLRRRRREPTHTNAPADEPAVSPYVATPKEPPLEKSTDSYYAELPQERQFQELYTNVNAHELPGDSTGRGGHH